VIEEFLLSITQNNILSFIGKLNFDPASINEVIQIPNNWKDNLMKLTSEEKMYLEVNDIQI